MKRRTVLVTTAVVSALLLSGAAAVAANVGLLSATTGQATPSSDGAEQSVGELSPADAELLDEMPVIVAEPTGGAQQRRRPASGATGPKGADEGADAGSQADDDGTSPEPDDQRTAESDDEADRENDDDYNSDDSDVDEDYDSGEERPGADEDD